MIKKILLSIICIPIFLLLVKSISEKLRTHGVVKVADTQLCIPKEYELSVNLPFLWFASDHDENAAGGLYLIPAEEINKHVDGYTLSHANQYNVDLSHDISGIIWAKSQIGNPDGMAEKAWNLSETEEQPHHIYNEELGLFELGDKRYMETWWSLARSEPLGSKVIRPPNWYFGYCSGKKPANYTCSQDLIYKNLYFSYKVQHQDILVADAVKKFIISKFGRKRQTNPIYQAVDKFTTLIPPENQRRYYEKISKIRLANSDCRI